ncbi:hypothetical protein IKJ53_06085 [bacterium]|nr:hypothetical protein [bacterium]
MAKILLVTDDINLETDVQTTLLTHEIEVMAEEIDIADSMNVDVFDIVMLDSALKSSDIRNVYKTVKKYNSIVLLVMRDEDAPNEILSTAHLFVSYPLNKDLLKSSINSGLRTKKGLNKLSSSNKELANSLYQLDVLYKTSSSLSGTLDRNDLISIMNEGIDKSLNPNLSCTLSFKDKSTPVLHISSNYKMSSRLVEALKLRAVLNYRSSIEVKNENFGIDDIEVVENIKFNNDEYDFEVLNYQKSLSYVVVDKKCCGYSEIFREKEFTIDDITCFQTIVNQVSLPLKSAILYQEILEKNDKLAKLERLKSEFISIVSHELKTPLTSIKNSLDIILSKKTGEITEPMQRFLDMAKRNVQKLSRIINDLLDMSKIEAGKMDYSFKITNIEPVLEDVKNNLSEIAKQKNIHIYTEVQEELPNVYIDTDRIEQVLSNLVSNSIKFSPEESDIVIRVNMVEAQDIVAHECFMPKLKKLNGSYIKISVIDKGIGIDEKDLAHVFDKFEQIENAMTREVGGTGLGLSIAKQLITAHNGMIWCDSELEKGSSFNFLLPVEKNTNSLQKEKP